MNRVKILPIEEINETIQRLSEQDPELSYEEMKRLLVEQEAAYRATAGVLKKMLEQCPE